MSRIFKTGFGNFVCEGDKIHATYNGFDLTATIYRDDCCDTPEQRDDGFWPSLDPDSAGYIGPKSKSAFARHMAKAEAVMAAWERDEWFYCGVAVTVEKAGVRLTSRYDNALWGIECNYPSKRKNSYLRDVADELTSEALVAARGKLAQLCCAESV